MVTEWARKWMVNFNPNKTEAMFFRYFQDQEYPVLVLDNVNVKFVSQHKHLGLTFSENMKWKCHIDSVLSSKDGNEYSNIRIFVFLTNIRMRFRIRIFVFFHVHIFHSSFSRVFA